MSLGDHLAYVALAAREPAALEHVLGNVLGLKRHDLASGAGDRVAVFAAGSSALAVYPLGHSDIAGSERPGVHHVTLGVANLDDGLATAAAAGIEPARDAKPVRGLGGHRMVALDAAATGHVATRLIEGLALEPFANADIERIDHIGVASADNAVGKEAWVNRLGRPLESEQTDMEVMIAVESFTSNKHGVIYHTRPPVPVGGLRVAFITVGDTELELLANFDPRQKGEVDHATPGTTRQDQGAIAKYVAARGPGLHHLALKTPDIDGVLAKLDAAGVPLIDRKGRPGSRAGLIGFLHPKGTGGVLLHLDQRP